MTRFGTLTAFILSEFVLLSHSVPRLISLFPSSRLLWQQTLFHLKQSYMDTSTGNRQSIRRPRLNSLKLSVFVENFSLIILIIIFFKINSVFVKIKVKYEKCTFKKNEICIFIGRAVKVPHFSLEFQN